MTGASNGTGPKGPAPLIDPAFVITLKGKSYPTWPGVLDAATKAGLKSLTTELLQAPSPENGHTAIVQATAVFEDGRTFSDLGDASPANCSAQIATAAIRMASTRGKGRVLRDALNIGQTLFEELPDLNAGDEDTAAAPATNGRGKHAAGCATCGQGLTPGQAAFSTKTYGKPLCPEHQKAVFA